MAKNNRNQNSRSRSQSSSSRGRSRTRKPSTAGIESKRGSFGPVSTINTAPVAIGNSLQGFEAKVLNTAGGVRVVGRDYAFTPAATGTVTKWACTGGMPLTPCCMPSTILRNYVQMYNRCKWIDMKFHYITSSSTATTGDVVFYHSKNAASQLPNWSSASFLPYVMSDAGTVIGPQWTNHTIEVGCKDKWLSTDYGADALNESEYSAGDIFLFSVTTSAESPGYVIFDYVIDFSELSLNPRTGSLPLLKAQWQPAAFLYSAVIAVADTTNISLSAGTTFIGGTTISAFTPVAGDIYEFVIDHTNSSYNNAADPWSYKAISTAVAIQPQDGMKFYIGCDSPTNFRLFNTLSGALNDARELLAHLVQTYNDTYRGYVKYITTNNPATFKQAY